MIRALSRDPLLFCQSRPAWSARATPGERPRLERRSSYSLSLSQDGLVSRRGECLDAITRSTGDVHESCGIARDALRKHEMTRAPAGIPDWPR
jgi:hypothetical protein